MMLHYSRLIFKQIIIQQPHLLEAEGKCFFNFLTTFFSYILTVFCFHQLRAKMFTPINKYNSYTTTIKRDIKHPREGHSKVKTARKATGNHLGYFP